MAGDQLPVLTLDFDDEKIKALQDISEKFKAAFSVGPGGFPIPQPLPPAHPEPHPGSDGKKPEVQSTFDKFMKSLNKDAQGTLKTFTLINKTLGATTSTLKGLFTETVSWGARIAAIGGGGLFGYGFMAQHVSNQYKSSQGLAITTGQMQAAHNVYGSRISGTGNIMQALAAAQNDPTSANYAGLVNMGINPQEGAAANMPQLLSRVSQLLQQYKGTGVSQTVLKANGLDGLIDVATANQVLANSDRLPQLNQQFSDQSQRLDRDMGSGTQQNWQDLSARFMANADSIGNTFLNALAKLNGPMGRISDELTVDIEKFLNGRNGKALFDTLANGLEKLGKWLGSDDFQHDLDTFSTAVKNVAVAIGHAIELLAHYGIKVPDSVEGARENSSFAVTRTPEELRKSGVTSQQAIDHNGGFSGFVRAMGNTTLGLLTGGNVTVDSIEQRWKNGGWENNQKLTRGIRNNNPGNINFAGQAGALKEGGADGRFAVFPTMVDGVAALDKQLNLYLSRGKNTISQIVSTYAPGADKNNEAAYRSYLSRVTGLGANDKIDGSNTAEIVRLIRGIIGMENGNQGNMVNNNDILAAMAMNRGYAPAGVNSGQMHLKIDVGQHPGSELSAQVKGIYNTPR